MMQSRGYGPQSYANLLQMMVVSQHNLNHHSLRLSIPGRIEREREAHRLTSRCSMHILSLSPSLCVSLSR
jgi:hypothetical protein